MRVTITVHYDARDGQTSDLVRHEVQELYDGLLMSLRTQVNNVVGELDFDFSEDNPSKG